MCEQLNIFSVQMNVDVLRQVALNCSNLSLLDLSGLLCVQDDLLFLLAENSTRLTHIGLKGCREVYIVYTVYPSIFM